MNHTPDTNHDPAADAIRAALPTLDAEATERIAARIAAGSTAQPQPAPATSRPSRRRIGVLRPALIGGVAALALGIALLAPGDDGSDGSRASRFKIGPDVAAAEALETAGDSVAVDAPWHALRDGEYHHTRVVQEPVGGRTRYIQERWIGLDGAGRVRTTREPLYRPAGSRYYVPAQTCASMNPGLPLEIGDSIPSAPPTLPLGSAKPACWKASGSSLGLAHAVGPIVAEPPAGAPVESDSGMVYFGDATLEYGGLIREADDITSAAPPGAYDEVSVVDGTQQVTHHERPLRFPRSATWVEVEAAPVTDLDMEVPEVSTTLRGPLLGSYHWTTAIGIAGVADLPTSGDDMHAYLIDAGAKAKQVEDRNLASSQPARPFDSDADAAVTIAVQLLTEAPMSPKARRATFDALARFATERDATVQHGVELADGTEVIKIVFPIVQPKGFEDPSGEQHSYSVLLDPANANLVATELDLGGDPYVTRYAAPTRSTSTKTAGD